MNTISEDSSPTLPQRLIAVCDISADPNGSLQFVQTCTTIEKPFVIYNPETNTETEGISGDGFLVCSIDNMPTQLPVESSTFFGDGLMPYIDDMLLSDANTPFEEFKAGPVIKNVGRPRIGILYRNEIGKFLTCSGLPQHQ
ncbi:unnamed protein product [Dibothriocephalus latus]|uniref:Uncharacterized protein n=1 Tax=Dibothriocephalus latus TaxID=60516 RepID=A0A3P6QQP3_DIBLA|nr:unnamed protein product [Dibothriocephalus latus]